LAIRGCRRIEVNIQIRRMISKTGICYDHTDLRTWSNRGWKRNIIIEWFRSL